MQGDACHVTRGHDGACDGKIGAVQGGACHVTRGYGGACDGGIGEWWCLPFYKRTPKCL